MSEQALAETPVENTDVETAEVVETEAVKEAAPSEAVKEDVSPADKKEGSNENKKELTEAEKIKYAMQKRIDRLTARSSDLERKYQDAIQNIEKFKTQPDNKAPKEADFESAEDYLKAVGKYEAEQEFAKQQKTKEAEAQQKQMAEKLNAKKAEFEAKEAEMRKVTPDYDDAVNLLNEYVSTADQNSAGFQVFRDVMMESNDMAAMSYHLGKNPDLLEEMVKMSPVQIARQLFRIEYELEKAPKPQTPKTVASPPNATSGKAKMSKSDDELSGRELLKKYKPKT